jgi:putative ABC transport system permease protein
MENHMETLRQDLRAALRGLVRNRGFAAAVILTMALGIGANSAIFSVVHGVLRRPLPYTNGDDILILRQQRPLAGIQAQGFSPLEMKDYRQQSKTLESIVEYRERRSHTNRSKAGESHERRIEPGAPRARHGPPW